MSNKGNTVLCVILAAVIAVVFGVGGGIAGSYLTAKGIINFGTAETHEEAAAPQQITITPSEDITIAEAIAAKVMPSVVGVSTKITTTSYDMFSLLYGGGTSYESTAVGTGVIVDEDGFILTNAHVVNNGDTTGITISLYDGSECEGSILWYDESLDLAVVKIEASGLTAAELGDSDTVTIGSYAAAIGNPLGLQFERSMSQGIISGLDRTITVSDDSGSTTTMEGLIQTDASINSGNSGGPLLNSQGQVIGINSAYASSGQNMGFAIPINVAKTIVEQIKETGTFDRAYLGIAGIGLDEQTQYTNAQLLEYFGTTSGIYVSKITSGGGAEAAGLKKGDIILTVDGTPVSTMNKINSLLVRKLVGDTVEVKYMRDKTEYTCTVTLTSEIHVIEME